MDDVDYFSKYLRIEENHQLDQKVAEFTFVLKLFDEIDFLAIP